MRHLPLLAGCLLAGLSVFLTSAKCIENDSARQDVNGDWHIYGEIHNETDIQGTQMVVQGTLLDENGNPLASARAATCPRELSPGSLSVFDVLFRDSSALPQPAGHKVNVVEGRTLEQPLPKPDIQSTATANRPLNSPLEVLIKYIGNESYDTGLAACVAMYDASGTVVELTTGSLGGLFDPSKAGIEQEGSIKLTPANFPGVLDATHIRYWLWLPDRLDPGHSNFQAFVSGLIPIQRPLQFEPAALP